MSSALLFFYLAALLIKAQALSENAEGTEQQVFAVLLVVVLFSGPALMAGETIRENSETIYEFVLFIGLCFYLAGSALRRRCMANEAKEDDPDERDAEEAKQDLEEEGISEGGDEDLEHSWNPLDLSAMALQPLAVLWNSFGIQPAEEPQLQAAPNRGTMSLDRASTLAKTKDDAASRDPTRFFALF